MLSRAGQPVKSFFLQNIKFFLFVYCFLRYRRFSIPCLLHVNGCRTWTNSYVKRGRRSITNGWPTASFTCCSKVKFWCPQPNFLSPAFYNGKKHVGLKWLQIAWNVEKCNNIFFRQIDPNLVKIWQNLINFHFQNILSHIFFLIVLMIFTYFHSIWSITSIKNFNFCSNFQMCAKCLKIKIFKFCIQVWIVPWS